MARGRKVSPEQIVVMLCQIEVQVAQGKSIAVACKEAEISEQNFKTSASSGRSSTADARHRWGIIRNSVSGRSVAADQARALAKRSPNRIAN